MDETIRVFISIDLSSKIKDALDDIVTLISGLHLQGVRLMNPRGIHLTLKYLGNIPESKIAPIAAGLSQIAIKHDPFKLTLGLPGGFPNSDAPKVLWMGVDGDIDCLMALHKSVENSLAVLGFCKDKRDLKPHLTVGRIKKKISMLDRRTVIKEHLSVKEYSGLPIHVQTISVFESTFCRSGAKHTCLASFPLGNIS